MTSKSTALLPSASRSSSIDYPLNLSFDSNLSFSHKQPNVNGDIFSQNPLVIIVKSALHSRSLVLTTLRILASVVHHSTFLYDFNSTVVELVVDTWPDIHMGSFKGKERAEVNQDRILASTLELALKFIENSLDLFARTSMELLVEKTLKILKMRLIQVETDQETLDIGEESQNFYQKQVSRIDIALSLILGRLSQNLKVVGTEEGMSSTLQQVLAMIMAEDGTRLVDCLITSDISVGLKVSYPPFLLSPFEIPTHCLGQSSLVSLR